MEHIMQNDYGMSLTAIFGGRFNCESVKPDVTVGGIAL